MASPVFAEAAQPIGSVTAATSGTFVSRGGKLIPASAGSSLYVGDKLMTRNGATARVALPGCKISLAPVSVVKVGAKACAATPQSLHAVDAADDTAAGAGTGGGIGAEGYVIGALALGSVAVGVGAATSNPASP